ncbi:MAG: hypothetical protein ACR2G4_09330 [Pyrinomonadaceae bacterium]
MNLGDGLSSRKVMIGLFCHTYLEKLWLAAEHEAGNRQIHMPGHRRRALREIEKLQGQWPDADEIIQQLRALEPLDDELAAILDRDIKSLKR